MLVMMPTMRKSRGVMRAILAVLIALLAVPSGIAAEAASQQQITTAVEALTRLENVDLESRPTIKATLERLLDRTRGTPQFVRLVQHFKLTNQMAGLLEVAINNPKDESGVTAMRLALATGEGGAIQKALSTTNVADAVRLTEALGNAKERRVVPILEELVIDETRNIEVRRAAVTALTQTEEGASALLSAARQQKLSDNLKFLAGSQLQGVRWPAIKREAAQVLPLPSGQNSEPLPPVGELIRMKGEAARGAEVYRRETTGCIKCHQVRGEGRDVGPALTEIGSKLPKEALIEAILDPSAGISFGFEAWQVELKSGDDAYGLKANETAEEVAIKDVNGIVTRYKRSEISSLQQSKVSIMPAGLQQTMTTQELVDLIEYLVALKKPAGP
jgi:putative heme-binding domain-containing protein